MERLCSWPSQRPQRCDKSTNYTILLMGNDDAFYQVCITPKLKLSNPKPVVRKLSSSLVAAWLASNLLVEKAGIRCIAFGQQAADESTVNAQIKYAKTVHTTQL